PAGKAGTRSSGDLHDARGGSGQSGLGTGAKLNFGFLQFKSEGLRRGCRGQRPDGHLESRPSGPPLPPRRFGPKLRGAGVPPRRLPSLGGVMSNLMWLVLGAIGVAAVWAIARTAGRSSRTRTLVLEDVKRMLHGGVIETLPGRGPQTRGRLGELEI